MGKRWTMQDDLFLFAYYDEVGDSIGPHDLGRPAGAATSRVAKLKATGAWTALAAREEAEQAYRHALGIYSLPELEGASA
jgi:hypothetical protein